jgi:hypothetical protein
MGNLPLISMRLSMKKVKIILIIIRIISVLVWRAVGLKMGRKEFMGLRVNCLS